MTDELENKIIFGKYKVGNKIGEGSFGKIYLCNNTLTGEHFALKFESRKNSQSLLEQEACIIAYMQGGKFTLI
jgi:serine/threonine protein kinase